MDSSYFLISNSTSTTSSTSSSISSTNNNHNSNSLSHNVDFEQSTSSSSPFNDDPFDGFPFLDPHNQNNSRLYDYFSTGSDGGDGGGGSGGCGMSSGGDSGISSNGRTSPISLLISQYPTLLHHDHHLDHLHNHHHQSLKSSSSLSINDSPFHSSGDLSASTVGGIVDADDLHGTLLTGAFVGGDGSGAGGCGGLDSDQMVAGDCELGVDCDAGYISGVDLFAATNAFVECSVESTEAYYLRLALEQQANCNNIISSHHNNNNLDNNSNTNYLNDSSNGSLNCNRNVDVNGNCGNLSGCGNSSSSGSNSNSYSDINSNHSYYTFINHNSSSTQTSTNNSNNFNHDWNNFTSCDTSDSNNNIMNNNNNSSISSSNSNIDNITGNGAGSRMGEGVGGKRSVLMNLLIDGSDVGAGYTSHNCRALPQRLISSSSLSLHQQPTTSSLGR